MRIISGKAKGTKLYALDGIATRPTLDRVKESIFNIIQDEILNCTFLDLFGGSGAIGLEAASRGAKKVIINDKSRDAIKIIKKNIEKIHLENTIELHNLDYKILIKNKLRQKIDIIYIDPPYKSEYAIEAIKLMIEHKVFDINSKIIVETDEPEKILGQLENFQVEVTDKRKYGRATIIFVQIKKDNK